MSAPSPSLPPRTIGLIGGSGLMGSMFRPLFEADGHEVLVAGRRTELTYEALAARADVVIVVVPIEETVPLIRRIAPHLRPGALLSDFTSIKEGPVAAMLETSAHVIGCHPIFGPMADVAGQNVVLCPERPGPYLTWYRGFFERHGMRVAEMSPLEHDRVMAYVQGLTHFINIAFARTLASEQVDLGKVMQVCSPVYRMFFAVLSRILVGDPHLYGQMQVTNPQNRPVVSAFLRNGEELLARIAADDREGFYRLFSQAADYLGDYKRVAREESDFLVAQLRDFVARRSESGEGQGEN